MSEAQRIIVRAREAMSAGDPASSAAQMEKLAQLVKESSLEPAELEALTPEIARLQRLASAAGEGLAAARQWLADLRGSLGGLDVYDPKGRQRVATDLDVKPRRF